MPKQLDVVTHISIAAPVTQCFDYIVPVALPHIFQPHILLPGVVRTDENQRWFRPGLIRTVYFTDVTTAQEQLLTVDAPTSFTYKITRFTGITRFLVSEINGSWQFSSNGVSTDIVWTYSLACRQFIAYTIARIFVAPMLRSYLNKALRVLQRDLEKTNN